MKKILLIPFLLFTEMKKSVLTLAVAFTATAINAKTLIVYYSFTNNVHTVVTDLQSQTGADMVRIEPSEEGRDYAANNYAIGSALISAIRNHPKDVASYPGIKPVDVNLAEYDMVIVAAPLWWSNMAAPLQTFLFHNGAKMAGKKIGLIVSSASSGISGVEADAHRLIPDGNFVTPSLWIRSSQTSNCHSLIANWLKQIDYNTITSAIESVTSDKDMKINVSSGAISVDGEFDSLALYNLSGRKMLESSQNRIETSALASGIYLVQINSGKHTVSRKIMI
ncbi:MAG: T9SS type A sorting domain-containing protein [Prevotellaceae bacterium]|nr:T9SS type A sorting domain-containing protein [Prevotellaceae bacterium]